MTSKGEDLPDFAIVWTFFNKFGKYLDLNNITIDDVNNWLQQNSAFDEQEVIEGDEICAHKNLADVLIRLMRKTGMRVGKQRWQNHLIKMAERNDYGLALELQQCGFYNLSNCKKLQIIKWACEMQFDDNIKMKTSVNNEEVTNLRMQPLGRDIDGFIYWYIEDSSLNMRLIVEDEDDEEGWKVVCRNCNDLASLISYLGKDPDSAKDQQQDDEDLEDKFQKFLQFECSAVEEGRALVDKAVVKKEEDASEKREDVTDDVLCNGASEDHDRAHETDGLLNKTIKVETEICKESENNIIVKADNNAVDKEIKSEIKSKNANAEGDIKISNIIDKFTNNDFDKTENKSDIIKPQINSEATEHSDGSKTNLQSSEENDISTLENIIDTENAVEISNGSCGYHQSIDNEIKSVSKNIDANSVEKSYPPMTVLTTSPSCAISEYNNKNIAQNSEVVSDVNCIVNEILCTVTRNDGFSNVNFAREEIKHSNNDSVEHDVRTKEISDKCNSEKNNLDESNDKNNDNETTKKTDEIRTIENLSELNGGKDDEISDITEVSPQKVTTNDNKNKNKKKRKNALLERLQAEAELMISGNKNHSTSESASSSYRTRSGRVVRSKQQKTNDVWEQLPEDISNLKSKKSSPAVDADFVYVESKTKSRTNTPTKPSEPPKPIRVRKFLASCCEKCKLDTHPDTILLCDECDLGYHMACLSPPLMLIPDDDWFCPVCSQNQLIKKLQEIVRTLQTKITTEEKRKKQVERKKLLNQYVGIHQSNIIPATIPACKKTSNSSAVSRRKSRTHNSSSSENDTNSSSSMGEEDNVITTRRCKNKVNYDFTSFDKTIMEAIGGDVKAQLSEEEDNERPVSGKDIRTIIAAEQESTDKNVKKSAGKRKKRKLTLGNSSESEYEDSDPNFSMSSKESEEEEFTFPPEEESNTEDEIFIGVRNKLRKRKLPKRNKKKKTLKKRKKRRKFSDSESASVSMSSSSEEDVKEKNPWASRSKRRRKTKSNSEDTDEYVPPKIKTKQKQTKKRTKVRISDESSEAENEKDKEETKEDEMEDKEETKEDEKKDNEETKEDGKKEEESTLVKPHDKSAANLADDEESNESTKWSPASSNADVSDEDNYSSSSNFASDSEIKAPVHIS